MSGVHVERRKIREGEEGEGEGEEQFNATFRCDFSRASERRRDESYERGYFNRVTRDFKGYRARHVAIRETSDAVVMSCAMMMTKMMIQSRSCPFSSFGKEAKWKSFSSTTTREKRKRRVRRDASASTVLNEYESILNQSPMLVKSVTSLFGFGIADVVAQTLTTLTSADASRGSLVYLDKARTLRFAVFGFLFGRKRKLLQNCSASDVPGTDKTPTQRSILSSTRCVQIRRRVDMDQRCLIPRS